MSLAVRYRPTTHGQRYLARRLNALTAQSSPVRVVVDSTSTDGSVAYLRAEHPEVEVLALRENRGYAGYRATDAELQSSVAPEHSVTFPFQPVDPLAAPAREYGYGDFPELFWDLDPDATVDREHPSVVARLLTGGSVEALRKSLSILA